jgi:predicted acylesterase/phospholipase RssA
VIRFVAVVRAENGANTVLRSYLNEKRPNMLANNCKIWEAARATSAASTLFERISIGPHNETFVDGALGYNNPIRLLDRESKDAWPNDDRLFLSIGTGSAPGASLEGNLLDLAHRLKDIVNETHKTAEEFEIDNPELVDDRRYFRFNVYYGLENVGIEEYRARQQIYSSTATYLETAASIRQTRQFIRETCSSGMFLQLSENLITDRHRESRHARPIQCKHESYNSWSCESFYKWQPI